jgi:hypothetical protein
MNVRIIKCQLSHWPNARFVPQWDLGNGRWMEFLGYDDGSPYLHVKTFSSSWDAEQFLKDPSIFTGDVILCDGGNKNPSPSGQKEVT